MRITNWMRREAFRGKNYVTHRMEFDGKGGDISIPLHCQDDDEAYQDMLNEYEKYYRGWATECRVTRYERGEKIELIQVALLLP